jgi:nucleotide-binding universal stress UspA family protein
MGTHGRHGLERMFLGSTAEGVVRMTAVPTFVVRQPDAGTEPAVSETECTFDRILVAVDDSEPSDAAVAFALDLAAAHNSRLFCCTVVDTGELIDKATTYGYDPESLMASLHAGAAELIAAKTAGAAAAGVTVEPIVVEGDAAEAVLKSAADKRAGLIVVGTHGRRGLRRLFIGSVAENIIRRSGVPVAVVREPANTRP